MRTFVHDSKVNFNYFRIGLRRSLDRRAIMKIARIQRVPREKECRCLKVKLAKRPRVNLLIAFYCDHARESPTRVHCQRIRFNVKLNEKKEVWRLFIEIIIQIVAWRRCDFNSIVLCYCATSFQLSLARYHEWQWNWKKNWLATTPINLIERNLWTVSVRLVYRCYRWRLK